jgi:hypothetical protein
VAPGSRRFKPFARFRFPSRALKEDAMRKWTVSIIVAAAAAGFAALPAASEACCRRRCRPAPCPAPCPWTPCPPVVLGPAWAPAPPLGYVPARTVSIKGKTYQILATTDQGANEVEELEKNRSALAAGADVPPEDVFAGTARRLAKTTIFTGDPKAFASVGDLRDWLPDNDHMVGLQIGKGPDVKRVDEEKSNVTVDGFIYAFRKESDNDYHVIVGDAPDAANPRYLNVEVSGIPAAGTDANRDQLKAVRKAFQQAFNLESEGPDSYFRPQPPVPVKITGSLFWDPEHEPPHTVGPQDFQPKTAWEVHPVSQIEFP